MYVLISNIRRVLNVVCFLLGHFRTSEFYMPTFRNTLFHLHRWVGTVPTRPLRWNRQSIVKCVWNLMAHGDAREGKWRGNWRMEWVASTLTLPRNMVYPALLTLMRTPRLPAFDWTDAPDDLNGLVRLGERRNLVSARVPSVSARALPPFVLHNYMQFVYHRSYTNLPYGSVFKWNTNTSKPMTH